MSLKAFQRCNAFFLRGPRSFLLRLSPDWMDTLATWCEELTHWTKPWCWERLKARGEGDDRGWDGWMASVTRWTWIWASSRSRWWTGKPGVLQSMGLQRVGHDWVTGLNWTELNWLDEVPPHCGGEPALLRAHQFKSYHGLKCPYKQYIDWCLTQNGIPWTSITII